MLLFILNYFPSHFLVQIQRLPPRKQNPSHPNIIVPSMDLPGIGQARLLLGVYMTTHTVEERDATTVSPKQEPCVLPFNCISLLSNIFNKKPFLVSSHIRCFR